MTLRSRRATRAALVTAVIVMSALLASGPGYTTGVARDRDVPPPSASPSAPPPPAVPSASASPSPSPSPSPSVAPSASPSPSAPAPTPDPPEKWPAFGAYLAYDSEGVERIDELSEWLGGARLTVGHTYLPGDRWSNIEGAPDFLESWAKWRRAQGDRLFVLNVPMQERNEDGVGDYVVRSLLRRGAAGEFDEHYRVLARRLVDLGVPDTVVVLGWEMNGTTYTHRCGPDPQSWKAYWRRIVTAMRSVPGQKFRFDFTPSRGRDAVPWPECYPGDDVVDVIGMDSYDQPRGMSFDEQVSEPYGLKFHVDFARAHKKPVSYPEWGLFRNGDNAEYMRRMLAWMDEHQPLYNTLTDYCPHGVWQCEDNPRSADVYRSLLKGRGQEQAPKPTEPVRPTEPVKPTEPAKPPACSPLDLGDWVEYWLGGKLCLRFDWWQGDDTADAGKGAGGAAGR
ncbi:glycoside hydrolase family 26 protein [Streptomyces sp. G45]|uniref:glycoside hydrolase family 26 protein n=1 Tax=Streptomyces sp. G45 TaxID=3406627 RepID=UPI003C1ADB88